MAAALQAVSARATAFAFAGLVVTLSALSTMRLRNRIDEPDLQQAAERR